MTVDAEEPPRRSRLWLTVLPLLGFLALAGVFLVQLMSGQGASIVPSVLIGHKAPETNLPPLPGSHLPGLSSASFKGHVTLLNVWASWCAPCREEQPLLMRLANNPDFRLVGLNYKDKPENALRFLGEMGNPFSALGSDLNGTEAINWGVYGVPETFLIGKNGKILFKHVGPLTPQSIAGELMPAIGRARAAPAG